MTVDKTDKQRAWSAINAALARGTISRPSHCGNCGTTAPLDAHHHNGYDKAHHFDVTWLCRGCHLAAHGRAAVPYGPGRAEPTHTPMRSFRIEDDLWNEARFIADELGVSMTELVKDALRRIVATPL